MGPRIRRKLSALEPMLVSTPPVRQAPSVSSLQTPLPGFAAALQRQMLEAIPGQASTLRERQNLNRLYQPGDYVALWLDAAGKPTAGARDALKLLAAAAAEGLQPADYRAAELTALATKLLAATALVEHQAVDFDIAMSLSTMRYLRHLHFGRVDPRVLGFRVRASADEVDIAGLLRAALTAQRVKEMGVELTPPLAQYRSMRAQLARYRLLAADQSLVALPPRFATVRPGSRYAGLGALQRWLLALGDLPADALAPAGSDVYAGAIVAAVQRFQLRHGLVADGVIGKRTQTALAVSLAVRVRQIELALERLRWLPELGKRPLVAVNIPMFRLWALDSVSSGAVPLVDMRIIVGHALNTRTPVFIDEMRYLIFRPYWNVPRSILRDEVLPALAQNPHHLGEQDMEIVRGWSDTAHPVAATENNLERLKQGLLRVRQRPGPRNALGLVKFVFPNDNNVYMHGTPEPELFSRTRRDFSHGCVRLEDPVALAEWVLKDQPQWTRERIVAAMSGDKSLQVQLIRPIQVILFYVTAAVMPSDGTIHFAEDIYGHDKKLAARLGLDRGRVSNGETGRPMPQR
ncbi:MAG: L,D-transpeptidase family protein [Burkholderiaceae bacterium]|nr:L,D-transpeptidase family protein [Burkholderiaceae bacterium]MDH3459999.1 L,D-transpeptidase family protein [Burkholderiaceae bacterium]